MFPIRRPCNGIVAGTWNESGGNNSNYFTLTSSIPGLNNGWLTTGWSLGSGGTTAIYSYVGAGDYTVNSTGISDVTGGGTTAESGGSSTTTGYNSHYDVNPWGGWTEDSDVETSSNSGNSHSSNSGDGGYVTPYSGGATVGAWNQDASTNSNYSTQLTSTLNADLLTYSTTGTSTSGGSDSADDSYDGNGTFIVSSGATTGAGTNTESGEDQSSDNYHGQYTLAANGNWYGVSGAGSSNSFGDTHSGYNGGGVYVSAAGDGNGGTWNESGGSDTNYSTFTNSTLSPFGWGSTGASSNGGDDNSSDSYNGSGTESLGYGGGGSPTGAAASAGTATTTESGGNNASDLYSSDYDLGPGNAWYQTDGTASSTSGGNTHSSFTGGGAYGYTYVGGGVSGTWNENGGSDTNFAAQSSSTYDPDNSIWVTTGGYTSGGDDNQTSGYNGSGSYDVSTAGPDQYGATSTGGIAITESGSDTSGDNYTSQYALGADGIWSVVNGSANTNAGGSTQSLYTGTTTADYLAGGGMDPYGGSVHDVWQTTESGGTHYSMNTVSALNPDSSWTTNGTGDSGGDDSLLYAYSDAGYSATQGNILDGGAGNASDQYDVTFGWTPDDGWQTTGGTASSLESG